MTEGEIAASAAPQLGLRRRVKPTAEALFEDLRAFAQMRLRRVDGRDFCAVMERGSVQLLPIGSVEWVEYVDGFCVRRTGRVPPPKVVVRLAGLMEAILRAPEHSDELPLGWDRGRKLLAGERASDEPVDRTDEFRDGPDRSDAESFRTLKLEELKLREDPRYVSRLVHGVSDLDFLGRAFKAHQNVLLLGPPGAGKSILFRAFAFSRGLPLYELDAYDGQEPDDWLGHWTKIGSVWTWVDGPLTALVRGGGVFVANELDAFRPEGVTRFHELLSTRRLALPEYDGSVIDAAPDFFFAATANDRGQGGRLLAERLRDRFVTLRLGYDRAVESQLCPNLGLLEVFAGLREEPRIRTPVSTRLLVALVTNQRVHGADVAVRLFLDHFREDEREIVLSILGEIVRPGESDSPPKLGGKEAATQRIMGR